MHLLMCSVVVRPKIRFTNLASSLICWRLSKRCIGNHWVAGPKYELTNRTGMLST